MDPFRAGARSLGIELDEEQMGQFDAYLDALLAWNLRANLTSVTDPEAVRRTHFLDSLTVAAALPERLLQGGSLLDVGTGAGFPGIPLKIAFPGLELGLLEATGKKTAFLERVTTRLSLRGVTVYGGRAETLAHQPALRERFDAVVARAVGRMAVLAEMTLPFVAVGGVLVAQKKGDIGAELRDAKAAISLLGGGTLEAQPVEATGLGDGRVLVVVPKGAPTPPAYPRRPGVPAKRPLGALPTARGMGPSGAPSSPDGRKTPRPASRGSA